MFIVIDTNILHGRLDPNASTDFKLLSEKSKNFDWKMVVPQPVVDELIQGAKETILELMEKAAPLVHVSEDWPRINASACVEKYKTKLSEFLNAHSVETVPFPNGLTVDQLFDLAVIKSAPFDKRGAFRDPVIFFAALEFAKSRTEKVYLVAKDGPFIKAAKNFTSLPKNFIVSAYDEMLTTLNDLLDEAEKVRVKGLEKQVEELVQKHKPEVEKIVAASFENPFALIPPHNESLPSFQAQEIGPVNYLNSTATGMSFVVGSSGMVSYQTANNFTPRSAADFLRMYTKPDENKFPYSTHVIFDANVDKKNSITNFKVRLPNESDFDDEKEE